MSKNFLYIGLMAVALGSCGITKAAPEDFLQDKIDHMPMVGAHFYQHDATKWADITRSAIKRFPINWDALVVYAPGIRSDGTTLFQHLIAQRMFTRNLARDILAQIKESVGPVQFATLAKSVNAIGQTPLYRAVAENNLELVQFLLETYPEFASTIDMQTNNGKSPLYKAVENGNLDMVKLLIMNGANPALQTKQSDTTRAGYTAYDIASENRNEPIAIMIAGWAIVKNKPGFANKYKPAIIK